jgi:hypothetical protein
MLQILTILVSYNINVKHFLLLRERRDKEPQLLVGFPMIDKVDERAHSQLGWQVVIAETPRAQVHPRPFKVVLQLFGLEPSPLYKLLAVCLQKV